VAADLGRSASSKRLDRIAACLSSRRIGEGWAVPSGPDSRAGQAGRPDDGISLSRPQRPARRRLSGLWAETPEETQQRRLAAARAAALGGAQ
jgi:hypothetical protein